MVNFRKHIIGLLVEKGLITSRQAEDIVSLQKERKAKLSSLLVEENLITEEALLKFISSNITLPDVYGLQLSQLKITPETLNSISYKTVKEYRLCPLLRSGQRLTIGVASLLSMLDFDDIAELHNSDVTPVVLSEAELSGLIERYYPDNGPGGQKFQKMEDIFGSIVKEMPILDVDEMNTSDLFRLTKEMPIVKATDFIINKAVESKASDILVEPLEGATRIRLRIDGILHQVETFPREYHPLIISRVKIIANLDIAEHRLPQDGQFKMKTEDRDIDFRVSVFPTTNGEKIVIRVLDKSQGTADIDKLGFDEDKLKRLKKTALLPYGMILACGPTGSGKSSTLYSILKYVHTPQKNIITVEDPVEYQLKGINQVSVNLKTGLTFARALRAILRQDPDIIMIGEIRDSETVDIAVKAALTGHLVLSTLHTNTACASVVRLVDMGIEPFLINASLACVISQRLARRICLKCKENVPQQSYFRGAGCAECGKSGYSGRVLISEFLYMTSEIREAIVAKNLSEVRLREIAVSQGMRTLREEGKVMALSGITTYEEVLRVTPADS